MQPTDHRVRSVFAFPEGNAKAGRRNERGASVRHQGLVSKESTSMKDRLIRLLSAAGAVVAMAIAGGASLKGF